MKKSNYQLDLYETNCQLARAISLLNVFQGWFDESHRTEDLNRKVANGDISRAWEPAQDYSTVLFTGMTELNAVMKQLEKIEMEDLA